MYKILLADDHEIFLQGLNSLLGKEDDLNVIATCSDGQSAWQIIQSETPDIAVLDFRMPHMNGIEITRLVRDNNLITKVILLTMHDDPLLINEASQAGVSGYVIKETAFENLVVTIKDTINGKVFEPKDLLVSPTFSPQQAKFAQLSKQERLVLRAIAMGQTNKEIARDLAISPKTVETYRSRIMDKLDLHSIAELTKYAIRIGIVN